jgi:serpin B
MKRLHWTICGLALALAVPGCLASDAPNDAADTGNEPEDCGDRDAPDATADELQTNALGDLQVGTTLLGELGRDETNVLLSPFSLRVAFAQVYAGTHGVSRHEIERILAFDGLGPERTHGVMNTVSQGLAARSAEATDEVPELIVRPINRSFLDVDYEAALNPAWAERVQSSYGACIEVFDLNEDPEYTRQYVNGWVAGQTNDLIPELVKFLPDVTSLIVVNALYFKAAWAVPFEESASMDAPFTTLDGPSKAVEMMRAPLLEGSYAQDAGWQAVAIPYSDRRLEMVVVLPADGTQAELEASLDAAMLDDILSRLAPSVVDLRMPKFDLMSSWTLKPTLQALGMVAAFENAADFSPIADDMYPIFEVFHDVAIAIDEKGTEAAAATAVILGGDDGSTEPIASATMVVDRTFYLAIRDRELGAVMFFARIGDPTAG